jgi:hypothetical protein
MELLTRNKLKGTENPGLLIPEHNRMLSYASAPVKGRHQMGASPIQSFVKLCS